MSLQQCLRNFKKGLYFIVFIFGIQDAAAQLKLIDKVFPADTGRRNSFMPLPALSYNQEAGFVFGAVGLYSFYIDKKDPIIRPSQFYALAYTSTKGQSQIAVKTDIWSKKNKWHHLYSVQRYNLPFNFYGVGNNTLLANEDRIKQVKTRLNAESERFLAENYYAGLGAEFESHSFSDKEAGGIYDTGNFFDKDGGKFLIFKISQLYDTRNSNTYTTKGFYARLRYGYAPDFFGGDNFSGSFYAADIRNFTPLHKKVVFGTKLHVEGLDSKSPIPFYAKRQMGNDEVMRGYYQGRYRANNYIALQSEIRYRFMDRFGIVAFGGFGNVDDKFSNIFSHLKPNYGIGGRFFFDLDKSLAVRFDYGIGEKPTGEKRISGFYVSLSEAF